MENSLKYKNTSPNRVAFSASKFWRSKPLRFIGAVRFAYRFCSLLQIFGVYLGLLSERIPTAAKNLSGSIKQKILEIFEDFLFYIDSIVSCICNRKFILQQLLICISNSYSWMVAMGIEIGINLTSKRLQNIKSGFVDL